MSHFISLDKAKKLTGKFRSERDKIKKDSVPTCETFEAAPFLTVLNKPGCTGLRIYYGMDDEYKIHAIIVGVNDKNEDMLAVAQPVSTVTSLATDTTNGDGDIIEEGQSCPPLCPPPGPLYP